MSRDTGISWAHHTHNLWWGCAEVSPACDHCYARTLATRYGFDVWGVDKGRRFFKGPHYDEPIGWNAAAARAGERRRVFVNSMSDIAERHPDAAVAALMDAARHDYCTRIIPQTPWLDHLFLSKRPTNYASIVPAEWMRDGWPANVWPGTTAENQDWLEVRIDALLRLPARVHWVSYEPALGPLWLWGSLAGAERDRCLSLLNPSGPKLPGIGWLIAGGESGAGFRDAELDWYRSARDQCLAAGVPFFFKQYSGLHPKGQGDFLDGRQWHDVPRVA